MLNLQNLILKSDSYKSSHTSKGHSQFPAGATEAFYYVEARGGEFDKAMMAGINALVQTLSKGVTVADVAEAADLMEMHFGFDIFNFDDWMFIAKELGGKIPLEIRAVPEGVVVPIKNPLCTIRTTHPRFMWLAGFFETMILRAIWYPTTVATVSFEAKKVIKRYLDLTSDNVAEALPFMLHDFGARGVSSGESSGLGGMAHLYNFQGTDNVEALMATRKVFDVSCAGYSIPAREHSTTTPYENELDAYWNSVIQWGDRSYAMVMDSTDFEWAIDEVTKGAFKDEIIKRGGTCVLRPDSGKPADMVMMALRTVERNVGITYNSKGYKVLHPSYRVIQGDGIDIEEIARILSWMESNKFSAENVAFGMGGGLLQHSDRDTMQFAMKMSAIKIGGEWLPVKKNPKTDPRKASKSGLLDLADIGDGRGMQTLHTLNESFITDGCEFSLMETYFLNGEITHFDTLDGIRLRSNNQA